MHWHLFYKKMLISLVCLINLALVLEIKILFKLLGKVRSPIYTVTTKAVAGQFYPQFCKFVLHFFMPFES